MLSIRRVVPSLAATREDAGGGRWCRGRGRGFRGCDGQRILDGEAGVFYRVAEDFAASGRFKGVALGLAQRPILADERAAKRAWRLCAGAVFGGEVAVAAGAGEAVGLAQGGAGDVFYRKVEFADHSAEDDILLKILFAHDQLRGRDDVEEFEHDGADAQRKWPGRMARFENVGDGAGVDGGGGDLPVAALREAGAVHFFGGGDEGGVAAGGARGGQRSASRVRGYLRKSSAGPNWVGLTKMEAATFPWAESARVRAAWTRLAWPSWRAPMVGTNGRVPALAAPQALKSAMVVERRWGRSSLPSAEGFCLAHGLRRRVR